MIGRVYIDESDLDIDPRPLPGSWEFVGLVRHAMQLLTRDDTGGVLYCVRDHHRRELIVCLDQLPVEVFAGKVRRKAGRKNGQPTCVTVH